MSLTGETETWVSRSAHKLAHGLDVFGIDPAGRVCVNIGASTGGFTHVLLSHGAVDVGHDQINPAIRDDPRVVSMEGVNAKQLTLEQIDPLADLLVADWLTGQDWKVSGITESPIAGGNGNVEFLIGARRDG